MIRRPSPSERFWMRVVKTDTCWLWVGSLDSNGYGRMKIDKRIRGVHRVAYELLVGVIPEGLQLDHLCRVRNCVNPEHLEPVTSRENTRRGEAGRAAAADAKRRAAARTHCPQGHAYTAENTYVTPSQGSRQCITCKRAAKRRFDAKAKGRSVA